jgi:acetyl-CoA carboxylase carboxyl transferase subunit beta
MQTLSGLPRFRFSVLPRTGFDAKLHMQRRKNGFMMDSMTWFKKEKAPIANTKEEDKTVRTEGLFTKCSGCKGFIWKKDLDANMKVCPKCGYHFRLNAKERLEMLFDDRAYEVFDNQLISTDPLKFVDREPYAQRLKAARASTGMNDAVVNARGTLGGRTTIISAMEYSFIGGSMGSVVGEMITRAVERGVEEKSPIIIISASGGARMHEGTLSLMQMSKISAALALLDDARIPFISILTDPTTGGVTASYAMLGDLNIAEPGALIGFAGPRVIEQTIRQKLPKGFQRSEFLLQHGMLDAIIDRRELRNYLINALNFLAQSK